MATETTDTSKQGLVVIPKGLIMPNQDEIQNDLQALVGIVLELAETFRIS